MHNTASTLTTSFHSLQSERIIHCTTLCCAQCALLLHFIVCNSYKIFYNIVVCIVLYIILYDDVLYASDVVVDGRLASTIWAALLSPIGAEWQRTLHIMHTQCIPCQNYTE